MVAGNLTADAGKKRAHGTITGMIEEDYDEETSEICLVSEKKQTTDTVIAVCENRNNRASSYYV